MEGFFLEPFERFALFSDLSAPVIYYRDSAHYSNFINSVSVDSKRLNVPPPAAGFAFECHLDLNCLIYMFI